MKQRVLMTAIAIAAVVFLGPMAGQSMAGKCLPTLTPTPAGWGTVNQTDYPSAGFPNEGTSDVSMALASAAYPALLGAAAETTQYGQHFTLGGTVTWSDDTEIGFATRADATYMNFYYAGYNPTNDYFVICKVIGGTSFTNLDTADLDGVINHDQDWDITFSVEGSSLAATLSQGGTDLAYLSATDSTLSSGAFGTFILNVGGAAPAGTFTDAYIVPEPSALCLLFVGGLGALLVRVRKS